MTANHPAASSAILDSGTPRLAILANPTKKPLKINKNTRIGTIYKCIDTVYILIDVIYTLAVLAITPNISIKPLSPIQKDVILGSRYQHVSLANAPFEGDTPAINAKFTLTLEIEAKLIAYDNIAASPPDDYLADLSLFVTTPSNTSFEDAVYTIATGVVQRKETQERVVATI
jgi:hypothetical protein